MSVRALAETSAAFTAGVVSLEGLANRLAQSVHGGCVIRLGDEGIDANRVGAGHVRPTAASLLRNLLASDPDAFAHAFNACIARTGQAVFVPNVSSELMRLWTHPGSWPYLKRFEVSTVLAAPLRTRDRVIGTLLLWRERPGPMFTELDLSFATQVADRLAPGLADLRQPTSGAQVVRPRAADRRLQSHPSAR